LARALDRARQATARREVSSNCRLRGRPLDRRLWLGRWFSWSSSWQRRRFERGRHNTNDVDECRAFARHRDRRALAILRSIVVSDNHLDLESIPPGTPETVDRAQAESIAAAALKKFGASGPPLLVENGMGVVAGHPERRPVWIVVVSTHGRAEPGGPACPPTGPCDRPILISDYALAEVDAQSGNVVQEFSKGHQASPSPDQVGGFMAEPS
jgi:hypothetical protein